MEDSPHLVDKVGYCVWMVYVIDPQTLNSAVLSHFSRVGWTLCDPMDYIARQAPLSWILQARILEWVFKCYKLTLLLVPSKF